MPGALLEGACLRGAFFAGVVRAREEVVLRLFGALFFATRTLSFGGVFRVATRPDYGRRRAVLRPHAGDLATIWRPRGAA
ncbi:hypothetical protein AA983_06180 [Dermacoccus sp. PE3]|nr:hypothetical protein AA983_06180 [Dermacoccus sp. PE3]